MGTVRTSVEVGPDRILRLEVPVDTANKRYNVVVSFDAQSEDRPSNGTWPPKSIEEFAGCITDEAFERPPQGEYPRREDLE